MSHTPGPWTTGEEINGRREYVFSAATLGAIAECDFHNDEEQNFANARLIAAAPDMLKALIKAREAIASFPRSMAYDITHLREIDAALGKATGSTTAVVGRDAL